jgi:hypothetical protein
MYHHLHEGAHGHTIVAPQEGEGRSTVEAKVVQSHVLEAAFRKLSAEQEAGGDDIQIEMSKANDDHVHN